MTTFQKLDLLTAKAREDRQLRFSLLKTKGEPEPLVAFCALAGEVGVDLSVGELFAVGMEYSDNQCKSTNGGNPSPYEAFDDAYENFISSLSCMK